MARGFLCMGFRRLASPRIRLAQTVSFYEAPVDQFGRGALQAQFDADPISVLTHTLDYLVGEQMIERVDVIKVDVELKRRYFKARKRY